MHDDKPDVPFFHDLAAERARLAEIAFRMLGSTSEADVAVEQTLVQWFELSGPIRAHIVSVRDWLTESVSKTCLERLSGNPLRREGYLGEWLPEPVPFAPVELPRRRAKRDHITLDESVTMLLLVVLDSLTAEERAAFILHDVFRVSFDGIAQVVGRSAAESSRLVQSARLQIHDHRQNEVSAEHHRKVVHNLLAACEKRDQKAVSLMLHPSVTLLVDSGSKGRQEAGRAVGADATSRRLVRMLTDEPAVAVSVQSVNGGSGLVFRHEERVIGVLCINVADDEITNIWLVTNPDKLQRWNRS